MTFTKAISTRFAVPQDASAVAALFVELGYPSEADSVASRLDRYISSGSSAVVVACDGASVVGVLSFHCIPLLHTDDLLGRITSLIVAAGYRRCGIGALLVAQAEEFGRQHGCARFEVTSGDHRDDAHAFYQRMDYSPDCRRFLKSTAKANNARLTTAGAVAAAVFFRDLNISPDGHAPSRPSGASA